MSPASASLAERMWGAGGCVDAPLSHSEAFFGVAAATG